MVGRILRRHDQDERARPQHRSGRRDPPELSTRKLKPKNQTPWPLTLRLRFIFEAVVIEGAVIIDKVASSSSASFNLWETDFLIDACMCWVKIEVKMNHLSAIEMLQTVEVGVYYTVQD